MNPRNLRNARTIGTKEPSGNRARTCSVKSYKHDGHFLEYLNLKITNIKTVIIILIRHIITVIIM